VLASGVTTRDRGHMQWTSSSVYDQRTQEKQKAIEQTAMAKRRDRDLRQRNRILKHVYGSNPSSAGTTQQTASREIVLADLRFRVAADGSKLIRVFGEHSHKQHAYRRTILSNADGSTTAVESTPKQIKVAGVLFVRSKNGNLLRSGLVKKQRYFKASVVIREELG